MFNSNQIPEHSAQPGLGECPAPMRLRHWLSDRLELTPVETSHINSCHVCQSLLEKLSAEPELATFAERPSLATHDFQSEPEFRALPALLLPSRIDSHEPGDAGDSSPPADSLPVDSNAAETNDDRDISTATDSEPLGSLSPGELTSQLPGSRYDVRRALATGGTGSVFVGYDTQLSRDVAIKVLSRNSMRDRHRFQREAQLLADVDHPNVVRIFDFGSFAATPKEHGPERQFLVMEFVAGGTARLLSKSQQDSPIAKESRFTNIARLLAQAANGLQAIHDRGLVHRDVKPSNLLITSDGSTIKVADFGLAKFTDTAATQLTRTGDLVGTPEFMSPEQVSPDENLSASSDVYSLGATLYFLATETAPFKGNPTAVIRQVADIAPVAPRILNPSIPAELETICLKAMEKDSNNRYPTAAEMASDLLRFAKGEPIAARPVSNITRTLRHLRRNPALGLAVTTAASLALLLIIGSLISAVFIGSQNRQLVQALDDARQSETESKVALQKSIEAADQLLVSVARDTEFLPNTPGSQEVSRKLLLRARAYFQSFLQTNSENPQLLFELARAQAGLAEIAHRLGEPEKVENETNAALTVLKALPPQSPEQELRKHVLLADTLVNFGNYLYDAGDADEAIQSLSEAVAICNTTLDASSNEEPFANNLTQTRNIKALALRGLGDAEIVAGKADDAIKHFESSKQIFRALIQDFPQDTRFIRDAATVEMSLATTAIDRGELSEGKQHCLDAMELLNQVKENDAGGLRVMELKGVVQTNLGLSERRMGNIESAQAAYEYAIAQHRKLSELEPSVVGHKWNLVTATLNSGGPMFDRGEMEPLIERWRSIVPVLDALIQAEPETMRYRQVQAMLQSNIAIVLRDIGQLEEALEPLKAATAILLEQSQRVGNSPEAYLPVALNHFELASTYIQLERYEEAIAALDDSDSVTQEIKTNHPDFTPAKGHELDAKLARFTALRGIGMPSESLLILADLSYAMALDLNAQQPDVLDYRLEVAKSLINCSVSRRDANEPEEADAQILLARSWFEREFINKDDESLQSLWKDILIEQAKVLAQLSESGETSEDSPVKLRFEAVLKEAAGVGITAQELPSLGSKELEASQNGRPKD
ncbi:MAG: protein kinase [Pirellulaceae bacterium]